MWIQVDGLHFHALKHTGNIFAAQAGPGLRDLIARRGHDGPLATLIYQHASNEADKAIADTSTGSWMSGSVALNGGGPERRRP